MKKTQLLSFLVLAFSMQSNCMNKEFYNKSTGFNVGNKLSRKKSNSSCRVNSSIIFLIVALQLEDNSLGESKASKKQQYRGGGSSVFIKRKQQRYNKQQYRGGGRHGGRRDLSGSSNRNNKQKKYGSGNR